MRARVPAAARIDKLLDRYGDEAFAATLRFTDRLANEPRLTPVSRMRDGPSASS